MKVWSHFALTSALAFSKIIEAIVRKYKQRIGPVRILCINVNAIIDTMLKFDANAEANFDVDAIKP